jgi:ABC-type sugar transport system ATPase subunit
MITVNRLRKVYGDAVALVGATLELSLGEVLAVVGPSGCGKTTLLRIIAGLESPDEGSVFIDGVEVSSSSNNIPPNERNLSLIFQDLALWPHMSVKKHIEFVLRKVSSARNEIQTATQEILNKVELDGLQERYPHQLSGGERQKLAIARALATKPIYLLMDEPFSNIDPLLREELQELVLRLRDQFQMGIVYVTHNVAEAIILADRIAVMHKGRFLQIGTREEVSNNPINDFVRRLLKIGYQSHE